MSEEFENPASVSEALGAPADETPKRSFSPALRKLEKKRIAEAAKELFEVKVADVAVFETAVASQVSSSIKRSQGRPKKIKTTSGEDDWNSPIVVKDEEVAAKLIKDSGVDHPGIVKLLVRNIPVTCEHVGVVPNRFVYRYGIRQTLTKLRNAEGNTDPLPLLATDEEFSQAFENLYLRTEIDRIYGDYSSWIGHYAGVSQSDWLNERSLFRTDLFFGASVFDILLDERLHRPIVDWFGDRSAARNLPRLYTQRDIQQMYRDFAGPDLKHHHLLNVYRGSGKTTLCSVHIARALTCCPDSRHLVLVEVKSLASDILALTRNKFLCEDVSRPDRFQSLFPEHVILPGKDSTTFLNPMRRLKQKEKSLQISSADASSSSLHIDEIFFDDFLGNTAGTSKNELTQQTLISRYDLAQSLRDPWGISYTIGTPYRPDVDLYAELLRRNKARNGNLVYLKIPVWHLLPEFRNIPTSDLQEHMVQMNDSSGRMPFEIAKQKALDNWTDFSRQYLCEATYSDEDLPLFDMETLNRCLVHVSNVPPLVERFGIVDPAGSANARSDFSCLLQVARSRDSEGVTHIYIENFTLLKEKFSDLSVSIVMFYRDNYLAQSLRQVIIEKPQQHELFQDAIIEACRVRLPYGILPLYFHEIDNTKNAKAARIRNVSLLMGTPVQIHFVQADWNKPAFEMISAYSGKKSGTSDKTKDDLIDCISLAVDWLIQTAQRPDKPQPPADQIAAMQAAWEADAGKRAREMHHAIMFGGNAPADPEKETPPTPANPYREAMQRVLGSRFR